VADAVAWLVACDLLSGLPQFRTQLPFDLLPAPSAHRRLRQSQLGAGRGYLTGSSVALDPATKQVFVTGYTQENVTMVPDTRCSPACGSAAVCCADPWHTSKPGDCFSVQSCADISWLAGDPTLHVLRVPAGGGKPETIASFATPGLDTKATAFADGTLYIQLVNSSLTSIGAPAQLIYTIDGVSGKLLQPPVSVGAIVRDPNNGLAEIHWDPAGKRFVSVGFWSRPGNKQPFGFTVQSLDLKARRFERVGQGSFEFNSGVGATVAYDSATQTLWNV